MAKILVIDHSPTVSSTLQWMLCNQSHYVSVSRDGLTALNALRAFKPDLVLLDIRLPHVDGIQLCRLIRADARFVHLPVIMLSGISNPKDIERALEAGANDYVVKPINDEILLKVIDQYLASPPAAAQHD